jgi:hypothetical protein
MRQSGGERKPRHGLCVLLIFTSVRANPFRLNTAQYARLLPLMPSRGTEIVVIKKNGDFHSSTLPEGGIDDLYKRCGFKRPDGFAVACCWTVTAGEKIYVRVYGKTAGRAGAENKAELPPPIDQVLFFGNVAVVASQGPVFDKSKPISLSVARLHELLDLLSGGSEDLGGSKEEARDALEDAAHEVVLRAEMKKAGVKLTKDGYARDGFVVDDRDVEMIEENDGDEDDDRTDDEDEECDEAGIVDDSDADISDDDGQPTDCDNDAENAFLSGYTQLEGDPDQLGYDEYDSE